MQALARQSTLNVVSPRAYGLILESESLGQQLFPEGLATSPYEILDYEATLDLNDPDGRDATFHRVQTVRFVQHGVSAILDHLWGDGVPLTHYRNTAGKVGASFKDSGNRHLVIELDRPMQKGETLTFEVERRAAVGFTTAHEWLETTIDHPIQQLSRTIVFPSTRPCQAARLVVTDEVRELTPYERSDGRTAVTIEIPNPQPDTPYMIYWTW